MPRLHTDQAYEGELRRIREMLLMMGAKVEEMLGQAMKALVERDTALAEKTLNIDRQINRLEIEVDDLCLRVLARRQPVASDLRFITMALKVVTDLERMGDLGVNICERVIELNEEPPLQLAPRAGGDGRPWGPEGPVGDLTSLADEAIAVLHDAL